MQDADTRIFERKIIKKMEILTHQDDQCVK